jgi:hypothetical protein
MPDERSLEAVAEAAERDPLAHKQQEPSPELERRVAELAAKADELESGEEPAVDARESTESTDPPSTGAPGLSVQLVGMPDGSQLAQITIAIPLGPEVAMLLARQLALTAQQAQSGIIIPTGMPTGPPNGGPEGRRG